MQCKTFDTIIFHAKIWKEKNHKFGATVKTNYRYQLCSARHQSPDIESQENRGSVFFGFQLKTYFGPSQNVYVQGVWVGIFDFDPEGKVSLACNYSLQHLILYHTFDVVILELYIILITFFPITANVV